MVVVGAGVIGIEYASMFAALGTRVTLVEKRDQMLDFCDPEIVESLKFHLRDHTMSFRFGEEVASVESSRPRHHHHPGVGQADRRRGRHALGRPAGQHRRRSTSISAGLAADNRGRLGGQRATTGPRSPHIYAVGDVIGFPALAATSMDQGRLAAAHAFDEPANELHGLQPIGIYTIPEISYCGQTEGELTREAVPFEVGISRYRELARGQIIGDSYGMLKLIVHADTREILGVHIFGTNATELVHIGQAIMGCGGTVDYLVDTVLNYPTLSEAYKVAALDVANKLRAVARLHHPDGDLRAQPALTRRSPWSDLAQDGDHLAEDRGVVAVDRVVRRVVRQQPDLAVACA